MQNQNNLNPGVPNQNPAAWANNPPAVNPPAANPPAVNPPAANPPAAAQGDFLPWFTKAGGTSLIVGFSSAGIGATIYFVPAVSTALTSAIGNAVNDLAFSLFIGGSVLAAWGITSLLINKFKADALPEKVNDLNKWVIPTAAITATAGIHCLVNSFTNTKHIGDALTEQIIAGISFATLVGLGIAAYFLYFKEAQVNNGVNAGNGVNP